MTKKKSSTQGRKRNKRTEIVDDIAHYIRKKYNKLTDDQYYDICWELMRVKDVHNEKERFYLSFVCRVIRNIFRDLFKNWKS